METFARGRLSHFAAMLLLSLGLVSNARAEDIISKFPAAAQPLLQGVPDSIVAALWEVRQMPAATIVWKDGGGAFADAERIAYWNKWEKITGWRVEPSAPSAKPGDVQAQVQSGNPQFDVFENSGAGNAILEESHHLLEPLDPKLFGPIFAIYPKTYLHTDYWIEYSKVGATVVWNTKRWPMSGKHPTSTIDLFNVKDFPGKRCFYKFLNGSGTVEYPLLADGVSQDGLYPLDMDRAFRKLDTIRADTVWWTGGAQSVQYILDGECDIGVTWHGRPAGLIKDDSKAPIGEVWQDAMLIDAPLSIIRGTRHLEAAESLLAYAFTPKQMCDLINAVGYGVPYNDACLNDFAKTWGITAAHVKEGIQVDNEWYATNYAKVVDQFNDWLERK
jgi:putative spermidine/putrescine transport system substrate-binding protein